MPIAPESLRHLHTFVAVCDAGGFQRAADRLGVSQPSVSYRIGRLEAELGVDLFERPRRRIVPTAAGAALRDLCGGFFTDLELLAAGLAERGWDPEEPLTIACPGAFGRFVVFPVLSRPEFADLNVRLLFRGPDEILGLVESGACELGLVYRTRVTRALELRPVCSEEFVLVAAFDDPSAPRSLSDLEAAPFVTYEECDYVFGKWFAEVMGAQPRALRSVSHFERLEEVLARVEAGRGLSVVPSHAAAPRLAHGRLRVVPFGDRRCLNPEYAVSRPGRVMRPEVARLLESLGAQGRAEAGG